MPFKKGNQPWNKGKKFVSQKIEIIKCACGCGKELNKFDNRNRKRQYLPYHYKSYILGNLKYLPSHRGYKHTLETRIQISQNRKGKTAKEKNPAWRGGLSSKNKSERNRLMDTFEYKEWRKKVFEKDNYTCQSCGQKGGKLNADHIKPWALYPELRFNIFNGRVLCEDCHKKMPTYGLKVFQNGEINLSIQDNGF